MRRGWFPDLGIYFSASGGVPFYSAVLFGFALLQAFGWEDTCLSTHGSEPGLSPLLQIPPMIGDLGSGPALYLSAGYMDYGFAHEAQQAAIADLRIRLDLPPRRRPA